MSFKVGDSVMVLDEDLSGTIKEIQQDHIILETEDGFLLSFKPNELILTKDSGSLINQASRNLDILDVISEKESPKPKSSKRLKPKERAQAAMEVDLHIDKLVNSSRGMTNFDMLNLQVRTAKHKLEFAIKKRIQRIVFIHGVGEGVLRQELETLFRRYDNLTYYDASYQKYGLGATEVYIYQNSN